MTLLYVLVEMDETGDVGWRLYRKSDGEQLAEWADKPTNGQLAEAKALDSLPSQEQLPDPAYQAKAIGVALDRNHHYMRESHPRFPPWR